MNTTRYFVIAMCAGIIAGCAVSTPPRELVAARAAYKRAAAGQAVRLVRREMHAARSALLLAENSLQEERSPTVTSELAVEAFLKARAADSLATEAVGKILAAKSARDAAAPQLVLGAAKESPAPETTVEKPTSSLGPSVRHTTQVDAGSKDFDAYARLPGLATVREEPRGLVLTIWGSMLFPSNEASLLSSAQQRLNTLAGLLLTNRDRTLTIEGHTDSWGTSAHNQELSQQRADAVRSYIVSRGYPGNLINARGIGDVKPLADNDHPEGRADNQRVEIVVVRKLR